MSNERHYYRINVSESQTVETLIDWTQFSSSPDLLRVEFKLFKSIESVWVTDDCDVGVINDQFIKLEAHEKPITVPRAKLFSDQSSSMMSRILSGMHVPKDEQPNIILQIFHGINVVLTEQSTVRGLKTMPNVLVDIYDVTLQLQNINDDQTYSTRNRD